MDSESQGSRARRRHGARTVRRAAPRRRRRERVEKDETKTEEEPPARTARPRRAAAAAAAAATTAAAAKEKKRMRDEDAETRRRRRRDGRRSAARRPDAPASQETKLRGAGVDDAGVRVLLGTAYDAKQTSKLKAQASVWRRAAASASDFTISSPRLPWCDRKSSLRSRRVDRWCSRRGWRRLRARDDSRRRETISAATRRSRRNTA